MLGDRLAGIDDGDNLRTLDRAVGTQAGVVLVSGGLFDPAADTGRIDEPVDLAVDLDELVDGIHSGSRDLIDDHPLLPSHFVETIRLTDVRLSNDCHPPWTTYHPPTPSEAPVGSPPGSHPAGRHSPGRAMQTRSLARQGQAAKGRSLCLGSLIIDLVGRQQHRLSAATQHFHDGLVDVLRPDPRVDDEDHRIGCRDRQLGLLGDLGSHALGVRSPAAGIHEHELTPIPCVVVGDAISGHTRHILNHGFPATDHAIYQRRLTDIRPTNHRDDGSTCDSSAAAMSLMSLRSQFSSGLKVRYWMGADDGLGLRWPRQG